MYVLEGNKYVMSISIKRLLLIILIIFIVFSIAANQFTNNTYDLSLYEYIQYSIPVTKEENDYMRKKEMLYFLSDKNAPPFAYIDKSNGQYKGLVLDYVKALSIELEVDIEYVPQKWENVISSVISGEADMCDVFPSEERKKYLVFSNPIYSIRAIVMTNADGITDSEDLSGHTVVIPAGDYAVEYIKKNIPDVKIIETSDLQESLRVFQSGKAEAVIGDEPVLLNFVKEFGIDDDVNILESALYDREVCIGVNKSENMLVGILNKGILSLQKKNFVEKIQQKWFGISVPILKYKVPEKLMLFFIVLISILILVFIGMALWNYTLKNEVIKRTNDLNKSRDNLQKTVDTLSSFLICVDENGCIVSANKSFCDYIMKEDIIIEGNNYRNIPILNHVDTNRLTQNENEFMFDSRYYMFSVSELEYSDFKYMIVIEDITDIKLSQRQILQQNKMIALGQLAAGVAHEIRNPLGLIQNYCYLLKTYIFNCEPAAEEYIEIIESSVQRADRIVNKLLDFSHMDKNGASFVNLNESIINIVSLENKLRIKNSIEVNVNCKEDIKFFTRVESLNHIILNLLSNSIDSMPDGGRISIDCKTEDNCLKIYFSDSGIGISQENMERIFNPFFTTKKVGQGTGLGLYIVYNEVQKIGGEIQVDSELGVGTTFKMKFPILKEVCKNV